MISTLYSIWLSWAITVDKNYSLKLKDHFGSLHVATKFEPLCLKIHVYETFAIMGCFIIGQPFDFGKEKVWGAISIKKKIGP